MNSTILRQALSREFGPTAYNFALSVTARQLAFKLASKGFKQTTQASDTNGAPKADEAPLFDCSIDTVPGIDFTEKAKPFPTETACEAYACTLLLLSETMNVPLEYGRTPDNGPDGLRKYWSTPAQWAAEKASYLNGVNDRTEAEKGATYGATVEAIANRQKARRDETNAYVGAIAKYMAQLINHSIKAHGTVDHDELVDIIEEALPEVGLSGDDELKGAAIALFKIRKAAFDRGDKVTMPQPGMLTMFARLGVKA